MRAARGRLCDSVRVCLEAIGQYFIFLSGVHLVNVLCCLAETALRGCVVSAVSYLKRSRGHADRLPVCQTKRMLQPRSSGLVRL